MTHSPQLFNNEVKSIDSVFAKPFTVWHDVEHLTQIKVKFDQIPLLLNNTIVFTGSVPWDTFPVFDPSAMIFSKRPDGPFTQMLISHLLQSGT